MTPVQIPALDPAPLPAPSWLFHALLIVTFFVHVLFLNVTLGGSAIAAVHGTLARTGDAPGRRLGRLMVGILPASISFTITTGVAPLLFVQVLYAQLFYPATILVGWSWLALLILLVAGYYAVYLHKFAVGGRGALPVWMVVAPLCFFLVAGVQTLVNVLQLTPARWGAIAAGAESAFRDPTMLPRLLHFALGSVAVGGVFLALLGVEREHRGPDPFHHWLARRGIGWALVATGLQVADGFWFLFALPREPKAALMGGGTTETALLVVGIGLGVSTLIVLSRIREPARERGMVRAAAGALLATVLSMVVLRDVVRGLYVEPFVRLRELPTRTQVDLTILFFVIFVLGLATVAWMLRASARGRQAAA
jgi:hypothetical protein